MKIEYKLSIETNGITQARIINVDLFKIFNELALKYNIDFEKMTNISSPHSLETYYEVTEDV